MPNILQYLTNELPFHMSHKYFMFQINNTNHRYDNRRTFTTQQHYLHTKDK